MSVLSNNALLFLGADQAASGYQVSRSLRFNSSDSAYLSRTPASAGNRKTWTWAGWVKLGSLGTVRQIFTSRSTGSPYALFYIFSDDKISFADNALNTHTTAAVYRDPSAWYHIQLAVDTTNATASSRVRLWVNGTLQTWASTTAPTQNADGQINTATAHSIGSPQPYASSEYFNGYLADIHFIDGQALDPTSFTEVDATTGQLVPIEYTGTYGTNGFHLDFADNSSAAALGYDAAGSNDWTVNNISVTAGVGNDSLVDTPTSYGTDNGLGGSVRGNYCTLNPLNQNSSVTLSDGNLQIATSASNVGTTGTIGISSGKWYFEYVRLDANNTPGVGVAPPGWARTFVGSSGGGIGYHSNGIIYNNLNQDQTGLATYTTSDVVGVALNLDAGSITFYKNNVQVGNPVTGLSGTYFPAVHGQVSSTASINFGARSFAYTAPSGFKALCTTNLPDPVVAKPSEVMDVKPYTGNGSTQTISGLGFSPDFVWVKKRNAAGNNFLADTVRGTTKALLSDATDAEYTNANYITNFGSTGFTVGSDSGYNANNDTYVTWTWDAGSSTVTNTQGSITSQVRANPSAGFSIVTYTGNGSAGATIGHGLGVAPQMIIVKNRDAADAWQVYHSANTANPETDYLVLNTTAATADALDRWNDTAPTSTVFSLGDGVEVNTNTEDYVAYCWTGLVGYSSFGSYTGNGSADGPFVFCNFRPRWVMVKCSSAVDGWVILDTARDSYNLALSQLIPNLSNAEDTTNNYFRCDLLSNGFKLRTSSSPSNSSGATYIYAAFAESPFQFSRAR